MISSTYLLIVALHAAVLSVAASTILLIVRQARFREVIAICGLLAVALLPWITARRPVTAPTVVSQEITPVVTPAVLPVWTVITLPAEISPPASPIRQPVTPSEYASPDPWKLALALWTLGSAAGLLLLGIVWLRQRQWRNSLVAIDDATWSKLQGIDSDLPNRKVFLLTSSTASPCVTGFRHPRVVLPRFLFADESATALGWTVRHELSHLQAGDSRWMLGLSLVRCLHWWNPFVHHLVSRWADAREKLCDLAAADIPDSRNSYGHFLVSMAGRIQQLPPLTVAMARRAPARRLRSRIVALLDAKAGAEKPVGKGFISLSLLGFVAVGVLVSVLNIRAEEAGELTVADVQSPAEVKQPESLPEVKPSTIPESSVAPDPTTTSDRPGDIQIKTSTRFMTTTGDVFLLDQSLFDDAQQKMIMRRLAQERGSGLMFVPSLMSRSGQNETVEAIREVLGTHEQASSRKPGSPVPFVGIKLDFKTTLLKGGMAELDLKVSYRFIPNVYQPIHETGSDKALPAETNPDDIKILERETSMSLKSRMAIGINIGEIEPGIFLHMLTTVESISADGRPTVGFADDTVLPEKKPEIVSRTPATPPSVFSRPDEFRPVGPLPTSGVAGKLRLSADYVEFPHREGGSIPQEPLVQLVPSTSEISQTILSQAGAKVRKLKVVEIRLNEVATPWVEFPGLKLSAMASSDFKRITVSSLPAGDEKKIEGLANMWRDLPNGNVMTFCLESQDPKLERRLLICIDALK